MHDEEWEKSIFEFFTLHGSVALGKKLAEWEGGKLVVVKDGRFGPYIEETEPEAAAVVDPETGEVLETAPAEPAPAAKGKKSTAKSAAPKNRTASLFRSMSVDTIDLETALRLLDLPRVVGEDPASGEQITAQNGRFGPYLKKGTDSRSLTDEEQIFTITLDEALAIYAQPKQRGGRTAKPPLKELGTDPTSEKPIVIKDGRFGPYITDGTINATVPRGIDPTAVTPEMAVQLLAERAARLAERVARLVSLRRTAKAERKLAAVLFNFPPNAGATGTAAFLSVYASLLNTLKGLAADGYTVEVPESVDALREKILDLIWQRASQSGAFG